MPCVLAVLALATPARAQTVVTMNDVTRLEATADEIAKQSATIKKTDPATAASLDKSLSDLRDDIAVLRVKLRRNGTVTPAEFSDVQTRLSILRAKAQNAAPAGGAGAPATRPASPPPAPRTPAPATSRPAPQTPRPMPAMATTDRIFVNVSGGVSPGTYDATSHFTFPLYDEIGSATVARTVSAKGLFDITGGVRFGESLGVGVSFSTRHGDSDGAFAATVPDPLFFDSPRSVSGTVPAMVHSEKWFAVMLAYIMPVNEKMDVMVLVGPAVAKLKHDLATSVAITEGASAPQVTIGVTQTARSYMGFQIGADVQYFLMQGSGAVKAVGVGGFFRYSRARANLNDEVKLILGGAQVGGGLRIRF